MTHPNTSYDGPLHHVAYVETRSEIDTAARIHDELGFPVFVPAERVWTVKRGRRVQACKPLFEGYIFPRVDPYREDWAALKHVDGVLAVLGAPASEHGIPSYVPAAWVAAMQKAQDMGVFDRTTILPDGLKIGETVRISDGPFAGWNAEIIDFVGKMRSATAEKRVKLMLKFMGRLELDITQVEKL